MDLILNFFDIKSVYQKHFFFFYSKGDSRAGMIYSENPEIQSVNFQSYTVQPVYSDTYQGYNNLGYNPNVYQPYDETSNSSAPPYPNATYSKIQPSQIY